MLVHAVLDVPGDTNVESCVELIGEDVYPVHLASLNVLGGEVCRLLLQGRRRDLSTSAASQPMVEMTEATAPQPLVEMTAENEYCVVLD